MTARAISAGSPVWVLVARERSTVLRLLRCHVLADHRDGTFTVFLDADRDTADLRECLRLPAADVFTTRWEARAERLRRNFAPGGRHHPGAAREARA